MTIEAEQHVQKPQTFWVTTSPEAPLRYDGTLLADVGHIAASDDEVVVAAVRRLNGSNPIEVEPVEVVGDHVEAGFVQRQHGRVFLGRAYAREGDVFMVSVAYLADRDDLDEAARFELERMEASVELTPR